MKSKTLNIASALLTIIGAWNIFGGLWALFLSTGHLGLWMKMYGVAIPQTDFMIHMNQIYGLETLTLGLFCCVISLIPYRKAEKWGLVCDVDHRWYQYSWDAHSLDSACSIYCDIRHTLDSWLSSTL